MKQIFVLFLLIFSFDSWGTPPVDSLKYSLPIVFEKQREVIYGDNEADIYFSFTPRFKVEQVFLSLTSSHPDHLLIKSGDKLYSTTSQYVYTQKDSISKVRFKVVRLGTFSMASIKMKLEFKLPSQEMVDWVRVDPEKKYPILEAREKLIYLINQSKEMAEEAIGIFLYRKRFLSDH